MHGIGSLCLSLGPAVPGLLLGANGAIAAATSPAPLPGWIPLASSFLLASLGFTLGRVIKNLDDRHAEEVRSRTSEIARLESELCASNARLKTNELAVTEIRISTAAWTRTLERCESCLNSGGGAVPPRIVLPG